MQRESLLSSLTDPFAPQPGAQPFELPRRERPDSLISAPREPERLEDAARRAPTTAPDRAARVLKLQRLTGFPHDLIDRNLDEVEQQAAAFNFDVERLRAESPLLSRWLAEHPSHVALAGDDLRPLSQLERTIGVARNLAGAVSAGVMRFSRGFWGTVEAGADAAGASDVAAFAGGSAAVAEQLADRLRGSQAGAGFVEQSIYGGVESVGQMAPALVGGLVAGPAALLSTVGATTFGESYTEARSQGVSPARSAAYGGVQSAVEVGTELIPAKRLLGDWAARASWYRTLARQLVPELGGEQLATLLQDFSSFALLPEHADATIQDYLDARPSAAAGTLISTLTAVGATTAIGASTQRVLERVGALARESKTLQRDPDGVENLVETMSAGGPLEVVHLPVETFTTYFQGRGDDPADVAARLTGDATAYREARRTGEDLQVPLRRYVSQIAGTEHNAFFAREARFTPEALNAREEQALEHAVGTEVARALAAESAAVEAPAIRETVQALLEQAGVEPNTATHYATLTEQAFATLGARSGLDAADLFNRYGLRIERGEQPSDVTPIEGQPDAPVPTLYAVSQSDPLPGESAAQRRTRRQSYDAEVLAAVLADARAVDPAVDLDEVRRSYALRRSLMDEERDLVRDAGRDPIDLLRAVAEAGGLGPEGAGGLSGERALLKESGSRFGSALGVPKVFRATRELDTRGQPVSGLAFDEMVQRLHQDPRFTWMEGPDDLITAIDDALRSTPQGETLPSGRELAKALGMRPGVAWWRGSFQQPTRGAITFGPDGTATIRLFKAANLTTFLHESAHLYLDAFGRVAAELAGRDPETLTAQQRRVLADYGTLLGWFDVENRSDITEAHHEQFARGFEAYLMEGTAPNPDLRPLFARVRAWLVAAYRSIKRLKVTLTPEVRGVMDRLLATDSAIEAAQADAALTPLFSEELAAGVGLSPEQLAAYQGEVERAGAKARDTLAGQLLRQLQRERETWWKRERLTVRADVAADVMAQPAYRALALLQHGTEPDGTPLPEGVQPFKLSQEALVEQFGPEVLAKLPRPLVYSKKAGVPANVAAELLGFQSGRGLVNALLTAPPMEQAIDQAADAIMRERHGDVLLDGRLADQAQQAALDAGAEVFAAELSMLERLSRRRAGAPPVPPVASLRVAAERRVAGMTLRDLRPGVFAEASRRAGQRALTAAARRDFAAALEAKLQQTLNAELFKATTAAVEQVARDRAEMREMFRSDAKLAKAYDLDLVTAARALQADYGLATKQEGDSALAYLSKLQEADPEAHMDAQAAMRAAAQPGRPYRELTVDEWTALRDGVFNLWHLARRAKQVVIDGQALDLADVRAQLEARLREVGTGKARASYKRKATKWQETKLGLLGWRAAARRIESWIAAVDGTDPAGVFRRFVWTPISEAAARYRDARKHTLERYLEIVKAVEGSLTPWDIAAPELDYTFAGKSELLGALLHTGNDSNLSKLLRGRGWGDYGLDGALETSRWDAFVRRAWAEGTVTKTDMDFVQAVWTLNESMKPEAWRVFKSIYGYFPNEVTARPFETPWGPYAGGYHPAVADPTLAEDAAQRADRAALEQTPNSFMFPTTGRGFTFSRIEPYAAPLLLDLRTVPMHIDAVLRFIHVQPAVKNVGRVVLNKGFRRSLAAFDPTVAGEMLAPWLQRAARQTVDTPSQGRGGQLADRFFRALRRRSGMQLMVGNVINTLQQLTGLSVASVKVQPRYLARGLWTYVRAPRQTAATIAEASAFMRTRTTTQTIEIQATIDDLLLNPSKYEELRAFAQRHGYFMQQATQNVVDLVTWSGAYHQAIGDGATELEAVRSADASVRATQGSFSPEDLSNLETGSPFMRAFTMFYSYWNQLANTLGTEFEVTTRELGLRKGAGRLLYVYTLGFLVPVLLADAIVKVGGGDAWDEDDDGSYAFDDFLLWFVGAQRRAATAMVPGIGPAVNAMVNVWTASPFDDRISVSPAVSAIESTVRAPFAMYRSIAEGELRKRDVRDVLTAIGMVTGLPAGAVARPIGYAVDVAQGNEDPANPVDAARGLVVGR